MHAQPIGQLADALLRPLSRSAVEGSEILQKFNWIKPCVKAGVCRQVANPPLYLFGPICYIHVIYEDAAGSRTKQAAHHPQRRRFSGPVWPKQPIYLAGLNFESYVSDSRLLSAVGLRIKFAQSDRTNHANS